MHSRCGVGSCGTTIIIKKLRMLKSCPLLSSHRYGALSDGRGGGSKDELSSIQRRSSPEPTNVSWRRFGVEQLRLRFSNSMRTKLAMQPG